MKDEASKLAVDIAKAAVDKVVIEGALHYDRRAAELKQRQAYTHIPDERAAAMEVMGRIIYDDPEML